jgi:hypothetical protein
MASQLFAVHCTRANHLLKQLWLISFLGQLSARSLYSAVQFKKQLEDRERELEGEKEKILQDLKVCPESDAETA